MREQIRVFQARRPIWLDVVYLVTAFAAIYFLWNSAQLNWLIYPLRLLVTFIHETSHALAAIVTGGELNEFVVNPDGSGFVSVSGGNPILIAPAGYLGTAIFGVWLFIANNRMRSVRILAFALGLATFVFSMMLLYFDNFAPNAWEGENTQLAIMIGTATGGGLMLIGWLTHKYFVRWLLLVLAMCCSLEALLDITFIASASDQSGIQRSDLYKFAELTQIFNATTWAYIWIIIAIAIFILALRFSYSLRLMPEVKGKSEFRFRQPWRRKRPSQEATILRSN